MALNLALVDAFELDARRDPMGRRWAGWDRTRSDQELWEANRGRWRLDERKILNERFATLSYSGIVQVVAELTGFELVSASPKAGMKKALLGNVLLPGDPARDVLVGRSTRGQRNPVSYLDTVDVDEMPPAHRASTVRREQRGFLATNNPELWAWDEQDYKRSLQETTAGRIVRGRWSTGLRKQGIEPGDRVFLLRQGTGSRGIVGSGAFTSRIFPDVHWDRDRPGDANYALIDWDVLVPPDDPLPIERLKAEIPGQHWEPQASGTEVRRDALKELERLWSEHVGHKSPKRTAPRRGWHMDPRQRKKVEDAAQDRLMQHYRDLGWTVKDTRHGNPYDAVAEKDGSALYLEAKGTESEGRAVIVTRGEVNHAKAHPGRCVIGILSDVRFTKTGEVVKGSGRFRIFRWTPRASDLDARDYDFSPRAKPIFE